MEARNGSKRRRQGMEARNGSKEWRQGMAARNDGKRNGGKTTKYLIVYKTRHKKLRQ